MKKIKESQCNLTSYIEFPYGNRERIMYIRNIGFYLWKNPNLKNEKIIKSDLDLILLNLANYYEIDITDFSKFCYKFFEEKFDVAI